MALAPLDLALASSSALSLGVLPAALALALALHVLVLPKPSMPPGVHEPARSPSAHWLLGDLPAVLRNARRFNDYVLETTRACGERPWRQRAPLLPDMVVVATPAAVEEITRTQLDAFGKGDFSRELADELFGGTFLTADGAAWFHQRKSAVKFFWARMYREVATPVTHKHVARLLATLQRAQDAKRPVPLTAALSAFALHNFAELGFGLNIENADPMPLHHALEEAFVHLMRRLQTPTWLWKLQKRLDIGAERAFCETTTFIRSFVLDLVRESLNSSVASQGRDESDEEGSGARTMVDLFVHAMRRGDTEFSPELLCDLAIMFVTAGRATTLAGLEWLFLLLAKHPEAEQRIRDELQRQVPELLDENITVISVEQAHRLVYLEAAIKETMRLYPAMTLTPRQALRDAVLADGTFIPKGVHVGIAAYTMGRLESVWGPTAAQYNPDRFVDAATGRLVAVPQSKFFGFGASARNCIGMHLATLEMKMLVSAVLARFRLEITPNDGHYKVSSGIVLDQPLEATVHMGGDHAPRRAWCPMMVPDARGRARGPQPEFVG